MPCHCLAAAQRKRCAPVPLTNGRDTAGSFLVGEGLLAYCALRLLNAMQINCPIRRAGTAPWPLIGEST